MLAASVTLLLLAHSAWSQTCGVAPLGPCVVGMCPPDHTCLTKLAEPVCCSTASIITAPVTPTCVDRLHPKTGTSDCQSSAYLCNDPGYYTFMTQQCPRTCGRCPGTIPTPNKNCVDRLNPRTGTSDCTATATYCNNPLYYTMMTQQCPRTCGRC